MLQKEPTGSVTLFVVKNLLAKQVFSLHALSLLHQLIAQNAFCSSVKLVDKYRRKLYFVLLHFLLFSYLTYLKLAVQEQVLNFSSQYLTSGIKLSFRRKTLEEVAKNFLLLMHYPSPPTIVQHHQLH